MNGAESLIRTLSAGGVDVCFSNPGTSEIHLVAAFDKVPAMRSVLGLFEGVVTGAADGYARIAEKPACTLLHLGPGLANGLSNLHNAYRARVPIINLVGQHATFHLRHDAPLTSDIEGIARPYSKWVRTSSSASDVGRDAAEAIVQSQGSSRGNRDAHRSCRRVLERGRRGVCAHANTAGAPAQYDSDRTGDSDAAFQ